MCSFENYYPFSRRRRFAIYYKYSQLTECQKHEPSFVKSADNVNMCFVKFNFDFAVCLVNISDTATSTKVAYSFRGDELIVFQCVCGKRNCAEVFDLLYQNWAEESIMSLVA